MKHLIFFLAICSSQFVCAPVQAQIQQGPLDLISLSQTLKETMLKAGVDALKNPGLKLELQQHQLSIGQKMNAKFLSTEAQDLELNGKNVRSLSLEDLGQQNAEEVVSKLQQALFSTQELSLLCHQLLTGGNLPTTANVAAQQLLCHEILQGLFDQIKIYASPTLALKYTEQKSGQEQTHHIWLLQSQVLTDYWLRLEIK